MSKWLLFPAIIKGLSVLINLSLTNINISYLSLNIILNISLYLKHSFNISVLLLLIKFITLFSVKTILFLNNHLKIDKSPL